MAESLLPKLSKATRTLIGESLDVIERKYPRLFMALVHHHTTNGLSLTFKDKRWLLDIYKDNNRQLVIMKCSQVYMTEHALCGMFTLAHEGKRGMYVLPSKEHRKTFVSDRINRQKDWNSLYASVIKEGSNESDSNVYKTIFGRGWKFVGANVRKDFYEFPCDALFFDEYDLLDQDNILYAYDRVANTTYPTIWKFGNPTRYNFGIHAEFTQSNQKEWHVECGNCGKEQILDWYIHFVTATGNDDKEWHLRDINGSAVCMSCNKPFDRLGRGRWIALNPDSPISGYHITRLFINRDADSNDIFDLFKRFRAAQDNPAAMQNLHNNYFGMPYENVDFKISADVLLRSRYQGKLEFDPSLLRAVMGVDQGKNFTCVIAVVWDGEIIDVHYAQTKRWVHVKELEQQYNVVCTVVDAGGGGYMETRDFLKDAGHRYACYYRPKDQIKTPLFNLRAREQIVETNRTELLDTVVSALINGKAHPRSDCQTVLEGEYVKEMTASARVTDAGGRPIWTKGNDHFFHATAYCHLAQRISGMSCSAITAQDWRVGETSKTQTQIQKEDTRGVIGILDTKTVPPLIVKSRRWYVEK